MESAMAHCEGQSRLFNESSPDALSLLGISLPAGGSSCVETVFIRALDPAAEKLVVTISGASPLSAAALAERSPPPNCSCLVPYVYVLERSDSSLRADVTEEEQLSLLGFEIPYLQEHPLNGQLVSLPTTAGPV
jgi:hypothetical protein